MVARQMRISETIRYLVSKRIEVALRLRSLEHLITCIHAVHRHSGFSQYIYRVMRSRE